MIIAELHEIRVVCSDDALLMAFGQATTTSSSASRYTATRSILLTWLHDECDNQDALELIRDVYILSNIQDGVLLMKIVAQFLVKKADRALLVLLQHLAATSSQQQQQLKCLLYHHVVMDVVRKLAEVMVIAQDSFKQVHLLKSIH
jgi:hypothetical protein